MRGNSDCRSAFARPVIPACAGMTGCNNLKCTGNPEYPIHGIYVTQL